MWFWCFPMCVYVAFVQLEVQFQRQFAVFFVGLPPSSTKLRLFWAQVWVGAKILPELSYVLQKKPTFHETVAGPYKPCGPLRFKPAPLQPLWVSYGSQHPCVPDSF